MAILNLSITVPDAQLTRTQNALKARATSAGMSNPSNAQAVEALRVEVAAFVKGIVLGYEQQVAAAAVTPVDPA